MPRPRKLIPSFRRHKPTNQAIVEIAGKRLYLGSYNDPASRERYDRLIAEWLQNGRRLPDSAGPRNRTPEALLVVNLLARYWEYAEATYRDPDGQPTTYVSSVRQAGRLLRSLYGRTPASEFGPKRLKALRRAMLDKGWSRTTTNDRVLTVKKMFRWAVAEELIPPSVYDSLRAVEGLRAGRTEAAEPTPVRPVDPALVEGVLPFVSAPVAAVIRLQLLTAARAGELLVMRPVDIDTSGEVWVYTPHRHKTQYRGKSRTIYLGPQAQAVVYPFLSDRAVHTYCFSADEAESLRLAERTAARVTPLSCGNRPGSNRREERRRPPGNRYSTLSYGKAIRRACDRAYPPPMGLAKRKVIAKASGRPRWETDREWCERVGEEGIASVKAWREKHRWHPHQLRHTAATKLRSEYDLETARLILGHGSMNVTEWYAEADRSTAIEVMRKIG